MRVRPWLLFGAATVFGALLSRPELASAITVRQHAVACWWDTLQSGNSPFVHGGNVSVTNNSAGTSTLLCPASDTPSLAKSQQVTLRVNGFDGNAVTNASYRACVTFSTMQGGECGLTVSSAGTGNHALSVNTVRWQLNDAHYGYLVAQIPAKDANTQAASYFRGFSGSNP